MSGYLVGGKAASGSSADVNVAIQQALRGEVVKTITLDRGSEFARAGRTSRSYRSKYLLLSSTSSLAKRH